MSMSKAEELKAAVIADLPKDPRSIVTCCTLEALIRAVRDEVVDGIKEVYTRTGTWHTPANAKLPPGQRLIREEQEIGREQVRDEVAALIRRYCP